MSSSAAARVECLVVGAGVIGLACARSLAAAGREVVIVEASKAIGSGISSRNSEVIHAGLYYPPKSLRATFCVQGRKALYGYCTMHAIPHRKCGKLVVATNRMQLDGLKTIERTALANGIPQKALRWLKPADVAHLEPEVLCSAALWSLETGVVDSHALMLSLLGEAESHGAMLALGTRVTTSVAGAGDDDGGGVNAAAGGGGNGNNKGGITVSCSDGMTLSCGTVINCAGLGAQAVAKALGVPQVPPLYLAKGNYFSLQTTGLTDNDGKARQPFSRLVYPLPEKDGAGLGIHSTIDLSGRVRFGPDVEWVDRENYSVDPRRADVFYAAIRKYWPGLPSGSLLPDYSGIRPSLTGPGGGGIINKKRDFEIKQQLQGRLISLYGIESPGLTSCLAIADYVTRMVASNEGGGGG